MSEALHIYGTDMLGDAIQPTDPRGAIADKFIVPPFSVLNAREGFWQERKRAWLSMGIEGEVGRGSAKVSNTEKFIKDEKRLLLAKSSGTDFYIQKRAKEKELGLKLSSKDFLANYYDESKPYDKGTSIFDPVLCELLYTWFCPPGGQVVDPFAGGSVRGIVAHMLGMKYWGCDLRQEQIDANEKQAAAICPEAALVKVTVSGPMLRQQFQPCEPEYIKHNCLGRCCEGSNGQTLITVHQSEASRIAALGGTIEGGFLKAIDGKCPFKADDGLCKLHGQDKPFGCKASPFTLNDRGTLIVRNRYRCLRCYKTLFAVPAYEAHAWSLAQIFGDKEAARIAALAAGGEDKIDASISHNNYQMLRDNDDAKHGKESAATQGSLVWKCGDAMDALDEAPAADFVFSCPPYGDLEVYSDDPRDISNMEYHTFIAALKRIVLRACKRLKPDRFAAFVVGDFRAKSGHYHNFVSDTIAAFKEQGLELYNEAILVTAVGSLPIRITKQFNSGRKMGKTHQNVLVFVKGDWKKAAAAMK